MEIIMMKDLLEANEKKAEQNRVFFRKKNILAVNLMGGPGSGKTTLISALAKHLGGKKLGVIEGDISSSIDAERLEAEGVPSVQINTAGECHLDAACIREAADKLGFADGILIIENVGNLICPAEFDLGEDVKLLVASVAEGDDKPYKYVPMFSYIDAVVLSKTELAEAAGFDRGNFARGLRAISNAPVFEVSAKKDEGVEAVAAYLLGRARDEGR